MSSGPSTADIANPAVRDLFKKSGGERYGLTVASFQIILDQVAAKYAGHASQQQKLQLWQELRVEELVLARGCGAGHDGAWTEFLRRYRAKLYDMARGITKEDSSARDLADSIYADLYGTVQKEGKRSCRLNSYMGRGSLEGWLRTVMAQEFVNRYRKQKRLVSLDEQEEDGVQFSSVAAEPLPLTTADQRLGQAVDGALDLLAAEDRLVLAAYYLDDRTLTDIAHMVGVHESTISRRLEKLLKSLRKQVLAGLQTQGMDRRQAEEALEADVRYMQVDVAKKLQERRPATFQHHKGAE